MKKILLPVLAIYAIAFSTKVSAQSPVSVSWPLTTDGSVSTSGAGATDITASALILGSGISSVTYGNSYDVDNTPTNNNWQKMGVKSAESSFSAAVSSNFYSEYKMTANTGKYFQLNSVTINVVGTGGSTNRLVALYSLDGFITSNTLANPTATYKTEGDPLTPSNYAATEADPIPLINVGNTSTADLEGREVLTFSNLQINVNSGQTLSVRFYYFQTGTGNRFVATKNIMLMGKSDVNPLPLPLDFLSFKASSQSSLNKEIKLNWSTTNEVNTQKFIIESGTNGHFEPIGEVKSFNTTGIHNYTFTDWNPANGIVYYRLKQIDKDGLLKYSTVISVNHHIVLSTHPNPVVDVVNIIHPKAHKDAVINVIDLNGRKVKEFKPKEGTDLTTIDLSGLGTGNFLLDFDNGGEKLVIKIIKK